MRVFLIQAPVAQKNLRMIEVVGGGYGLACVAAHMEDLAEVRFLDGHLMELADVVREVVLFRPDLVGISALSTLHINPTIKLARTIKAECPQVLLIAGGHAATLMASELLRHGDIDAVVIGEGELTGPELLEKSRFESIAGLAYRGANGKIVYTPPRSLALNLDDLKWPAYHLMDNTNRALYFVETSRGCAQRCTFCSVGHFYSHRWRARSPERVIDRIEYLIETFGALFIWLSDDNIAGKVSHLRRVLELYLERDIQVPCLIQMRIDVLAEYPELVEMMYQAGWILSLGIESMDEETLKLMRKGITRTQAQQVVANLKRHRVFHRGNFIIGFPHQTPEQIEQAVESAIELDLDAAMFFVATPYLGTDFHKECQSQGLIASQDWDDYGTFDTVLNAVPSNVGELRKKLYRTFWLRPDFVRRHLKRQENISSLYDLMAQRVFKTYLQLLYDPVYGGPISWSDWQNLFEGLRELVNPQLATTMGDYSVNVKLDLDIGQACLRIRDGQYVGLGEDSGPAEVIVKTDNETFASVLGCMTREPLSLLLLQQWQAIGSSRAVLDWLLWVKAFQRAANLSTVEGGPPSLPRCLNELNRVLTEQSELYPLLEQNRGITLHTGGHSLTLQLENSRIVNLDLTDGAIRSGWIISADPAELVEALHGDSRRFVAWWTSLLDDGKGIEEEGAGAPITFPSDAWVKAFAEMLNKSKAYAQVASKWEGDFCLIVQSAGSLDRTVKLYIDLWHGECREAVEVTSELPKIPDFCLQADYSTWRKIISGQLKLGQAWRTKQLEFRGNMLKLMRHTKTVRELGRCFLQVPSKFLADSER